MAVQKAKKIAELFLKIGVTCLCLYFVYRKIDLFQLREELKRVNVYFLLPATLFFVLSKIISSFRLNKFFKTTNVRLSEKNNLKLYWLGMFYNLFLPGGIGGDGYKVYLLNKHSGGSVKKVLAAVFIDRVSGVLALSFAALALATFIKTDIPLYLRIFFVLCIPSMYIIYRWVVKKWFPDFLTIINSTNLQALYVQSMQMLCIIFVLRSLGIVDHYAEYLLIFLISSVIAVLPLTVGGVGARELVFLQGAQWLLLDKQTSVAVSLLFFLITAVVSLWGMVYTFQFPQLLEKKPNS